MLVGLAILSGCAGLSPTGDGQSGVVLLLSGDQPAYTRVAGEIRRRHSGPIETHVLPGGRNVAAVRTRVQSSPHRRVVAIGEDAGRAARELRDKTVVFCQVFLHEDLALVTPWMKGVALLPPPDSQWQAWQALSPNRRRIGVVTGPRLQRFVEEARATARARGIQLQHVVVTNDREFLYAWQRLLPAVDGLWLVPDHRVLSGRVIHESLTHSVKAGKPVLVFHRDLLDIGGLLSVESDPADVAEQVLARLNNVSRRGVITGDAVVPLRRAQVQVNNVLAIRYGLRVPPASAGGARGR